MRLAEKGSVSQQTRFKGHFLWCRVKCTWLNGIRVLFSGTGFLIQSQVDRRKYYGLDSSGDPPVSTLIHASFRPRNATSFSRTTAMLFQSLFVRSQTDPPSKGSTARALHHYHASEYYRLHCFADYNYHRLVMV